MRIHITPTKSAEYAAGFSVGKEMIEVYADHPEDAMRKLWSEHYDKIMEVIRNEDAESAKERYKTSQAFVRDENIRSILHTHTKSIIEREREIAEFIEFEEEFQEGQAIFITWVNDHDTLGHCALWCLNGSTEDYDNARSHLAVQAEFHWVARVLTIGQDVINTLPFQAITLAGRMKIEELGNEFRQRRYKSVRQLQEES